MKIKSGRHHLTAVLLSVAALIFSALSVWAFVPMRWGTDGVRGAWALSRFPLTFYLNDASAKGTSNVSPGSDPLAAVRGALSSWQSIQTAQIRFADLKITSTDSALHDGINLITMADTAINRQILGGAQGAVALTRIDFNASTGEITESDIILNPDHLFSTNLDLFTYDLQGVITHELGHALGADHSPAQNDTMFAETAPGEFFQRYLSADAIAFASFTYPYQTRVDSLGTISGRISSGGKGIFGASVTAVNLDRNLVYASFSEPDGSYTIHGPTAGRYTVYAEPLDGPATPDQLLVQGPGAYYSGLNTSFRTVFAGEQSLGVDGSPKNLAVNFTVPVGSPTLNIDRMGSGDPDSGMGYLSAGAVIVNPGDTLSLWIGGANTWNVASLSDVAILGTGITLDASRGIKILTNASGAKVGISILAHVSPDAAPGGRTVVLRVGDQQVASTGGIVVTPRGLPKTTLYFPYLRATPDQYTGIALAHPDPTVPAAVHLSGRDAQGALLWSEDATVPSDFTLPGGSQSARLERQIFDLPFDTNQSGSMTVESDSPDLRGFFIASDFACTYLDGAEAFTRGYKQLFFVDVLQDANTSTEVHLMNTKNYPVTVNLVLVSGGITKGSVTRTIPAGGKIGESVSTLFGVSDPLYSTHVMATTSDDALAGFGMIRQPVAITGLNALPMENAGSILYSPHMAVGDYGTRYDTRLNVVNVGDSKTTVTVALLDAVGQLLVPDTKSMDLLPGAHFSLDVRGLFGVQLAQGYIQVSATGNGKLLGNVLFGNGDPTAGMLSFDTAVPLFASGFQSFVYAHVAQGSGYYMGLAFLAPAGSNMTVQAFDGTGAAVGSPAARSLAPGQRLVSLLSELIPETNGQVGGYVKVTSDRPLISFAVFGTSDGQLLSAVTPQRLPN